MQQEYLLEVYVDSVESALAAQAGGARRVELCDNLLEGGTTPSLGMVQVVRKSIQIPMHVIIRPRGGDFCYTDLEFEVMRADVSIAKESGANGVVIGILTADGKIDRERTAELVALARPLSVTFHRAFDMTADPYAALNDLIDLKVDRVLTSGQEASVMEGLDLIADLSKQATDQIIVMPCGGINARNLAKVIAKTGAHELHAGAMISVESSMNYRNTHCFMGGELRPPEYSRTAVDSRLIRGLLDAIP